MAKPKHIDLTEGGVITQEALLAYAEGRLSDAERTEVDRLLRDDPFAQDALEGLRGSVQTSELGTVITSINTKLREKAGLRERKKKGIEIHWANYAYAAVILGVLVGVGFVMIEIFSTHNKQEAMSKPAPKAQESLPVKEEEKKPAPQKDTTLTDALAEQKDSTPIKTETTVAANTPSTPVTTGAATQTPAAADEKAKKSPAETKTKASEMNENVSQNLTDQTITMLGTAKAYFEAGNYTNAEKKYKEILASQPNNTDALYFGGVSAYLNGSNGLGEANFDKLAKMGQYPEGTKWYKANILIKKGKKEEAKQLLRDLANSNSIFKERAVKQYEELYK